MTNQISVRPRLTLDPADVRRRIEEALARSVEMAGNRIAVVVGGDKVILTGTVRSWLERDEAERIAWSAPGVVTVENRIVVIPED